jgi:hypothetical protein
MYINGNMKLLKKNNSTRRNVGVFIEKKNQSGYFDKNNIKLEMAKWL